MLIRSDLVHCPALGELVVLQDHLLQIDASGFIKHVSPSDSTESINILANADSPPIVIPSGSFLLPTFCDLHLHAPQYLYQGTGLHLPLMEWLNEYAFKAEERLDSDPTLAKAVYQRLAERLLQNGTGAVLFFGTIKEETNLILAEVMQQAGLRAFVGKLSMDISSRPSYVEQSAKESLAAAESFASKCGAMMAHLPAHRRLVEPVITPRFVPTCSDELLAGLGTMSEARSLRVQSHLAEAHDQVEWVKAERGMDDIDVFDGHKLLTPRTIQAHCTFLEPPSLSRLCERGTSVAHCPLSNAYFSAKPFPLREALQNSVKVGLGTDVAGGYSLDIMNAMRQAVITSRMREGNRIMEPTEGEGIDKEARRSLAIDWKEALYLATRGGALALGLGQGSGMFQIGAPFDAQCIRVVDSQTKKGVGPIDFFQDGLEITDKIGISEVMVEKWWCLGDASNRDGMWVQGLRIT
ncbi:Metallo-dependent hydrolase [Athelia psychrophila]|uniref:Metallo-dependent hydrolase n=1 Tax=Athelia psychrophila TaxID=1759441 RepID=A0A166U8V2_9AGAM|nr:Metallo-dependent hydrolase [Fibularhizoctonia sp. CBS 109695]